MKYTLIRTIAALGILPFAATAQDAVPPPKLTPEEARAEAEAAKVEAANREAAKKLMPAADAAPEKVIEALYKLPVDVFFTREYGEFSTRFLSKNLKSELDADFKRAAEEQPTLTEDPRFSGDAEATLADVKKLTVKAATTGDKSTVKASFQLDGVRQVMTYLCEREDGRWHIADVKQEDGNTLMKLLAESRKFAEDAEKEEKEEK